MNKIISQLLKDFHKEDQKERFAVAKKYGNSLACSKIKFPYYIFKGKCDERIRIVLFLIKNNVLKQKEDFYFAASIIVNSGNLKNFILAYKLIKQYREMGGNKPWGFYDKFFKIQKWGKTKKDVERLMEKEIDIHPSKLDRF